MALYKDGNPISGLNSIPRLTLAQYNALNVKPKFWVRTDAPESYKKLSADQVSYDSNNTVKDKLDGMIESGSNTNGNWIKFADGTMICGKTISFTNVPFTSQWGSLYESDLMDLGDLPQTFYSTPIVTANTNNSNCWLEALPVNANNKTLGSVRAVRPTSTTLNVAVSIIAIGRWKA